MKPESVVEEATEEIGSALDPVVEKVRSWVDQLIEMIPNLVVAILVLLVFALFARLGRLATERLLRRFSQNEAVERVLGRLVSIAILAIGLFIALGALNLDKTVTSLLAGAGVVGIALAFAFQDLAANLLAGIYLSLKGPMNPSEVVETQDHFGVVERISLRSTTLRRVTGQLVTIPNKLIFEAPLINYSRTTERRVDVAVGVSYGSDLRQVLEVTKGALETVEGRLEHRDVEVLLTGFGGSSIDLVGRYWIPFSRQYDYNLAVSRGVLAIKEAYDREDIMIPFPIRTLDFGIRGGRMLHEELARGDDPRDDEVPDA